MSHRILLIEDDRLTQDMVSGILTAHGYSVDASDDGLSGVEALCRGDYDLALIDYHLPDVNGYASARLMESLAPVGRRPRLIAITADPRGLVDREGERALFDAIVAKPIAPAALCGLIERLMRDPDQDAAERTSRELWRGRLADLAAARGIGGGRVLPPTVRAAIERLAVTQGSAAARLLVAELRFAAADRLIAAQGWTAFQTLRRLFVENLVNLLGDLAEVVSEGGADFVIFTDVTPEDLVASEDALIRRCEAVLAQPLGVRFDLREAA